MRTLSEHIVAPLIKQTTSDLNYLWVESVEPGISNFQAVAHYIFDTYKTHTLDSEKVGVKTAIEVTKARKLDIENKIEALNKISETRDIADILKDDVRANHDILERLIKDQQAYIEYHKTVLEEIKQRPISKENVLVAELCSTIEKIFSTSLKIATETLRRYETQKNALIKIDELSATEIRMRIAGKRGLLVKDLSITEKQIVEYEGQLKIIRAKIEETKEAIEIIQKSTKK